MTAAVEDAGIMFERQRLEKIWSNDLTPENRLAWLNRWTTRPPCDAIGRRYVLPGAQAVDTIHGLASLYNRQPATGGRATLQDTVRPPATLYAWSQIFGTYRLFRTPVHTPEAVAEAEVEIIDANTTTAALTVTVTTHNLLPDGFNFVLHAAQPFPPHLKPASYRLRPAGTFVNVSNGKRVDFSTLYLKRWTPQPGERVLLRAQFVNDNNELCPTRQLWTDTISATRYYCGLTEFWP